MTPSFIKTIMKNADKIKKTMETERRKTATAVRYTMLLIGKMEHLLSLWVDDSNERNITLTQSAVCDKVKSLFDIKRKKKAVMTLLEQAKAGSLISSSKLKFTT
jgi:hypothetical protein